MAWLYLVDDLDRTLAPGALVQVRGAEAKHMGVARLRVGERVQLGDGRGLMIEGELATLDRELATVVVLDSRVFAEPNPHVTVVQALAKGGRDDLAVQVATELGAAAFVPWQAKRSVSRWDQKAEKGRERWRAVAREASKQSISAWVPEVAQLHSTREVAALAADSLVLVLDPHGGTSLRAALPELAEAERAVRPPLRVTLVVGPEGGIDPTELDLLEASGGVRVHLGASVLRTSSAAPAAIAAILALSGAWDSRSRQVDGS